MLHQSHRIDKSSCNSKIKTFWTFFPKKIKFLSLSTKTTTADLDKESHFYFELVFEIEEQSTVVERKEEKERKKERNC